MIRIQRPVAPTVLTTRGTARTHNDCQSYELNPSGYQNSTACFTIDPKIYGHKKVKAALTNMQRGKCCYCERKILASGYGDVEHFRPKRTVQQDARSPEVRPGYFWLAYEWSNLLLACAVCNTSGKQTFFPLENPAERARSHLDSLALERPMLVDPAREDPRLHIRYEGDAPYALTARGEATIDCLKLRRGDLLERRQTLLRLLTQLRRVVEERPDSSEAQDASALLENMAAESEEFSSMVRDFLDAPYVPPIPSGSSQLE